MAPRSSLRPFAFFVQALFPAWRFFVETESVTLLEGRFFDGTEWSPWRNLLPPLRRSFQHLFLNPEGNLRLAFHTAVERLVNELGTFAEEEPDAVLAWPSYEVVRNIARFSFPSPRAFSPFQFRIRVHPPGEPSSVREVLVSPEEGGPSAP